MRIAAADPRTARGQAAWIAAMEPWRSLGYQAEALARWLGRVARGEGLLAARVGKGVVGVVVVQPGFLLGDFISLLAVRPEAAGQGVGRALMAAVARRTFARRRWLYVSHDSGNRAAARFYRKLGFERVGRLPGLIKAERVEILLRKGRDEA